MPPCGWLQYRKWLVISPLDLWHQLWFLSYCGSLWSHLRKFHCGVCLFKGPSHLRASGLWLNLVAEATDEKHGTKSVYSNFFQPSPLMSHAPLCCPYLWDFSKLCLSVEIKYRQRSSATEQQDWERREKKTIIDLGHLDWLDCREENHISNGIEMAEDWQWGRGAVERCVAGLRGRVLIGREGNASGEVMTATMTTRTPEKKKETIIEDYPSTWFHLNNIFSFFS